MTYKFPYKDYSSEIQIFEHELLELRNQLESHELYENLTSINDIQIFMENHVFAVWDFMSLVKALQIKLTHRSIPWIPSGKPIITRFINEIVYGEESDLDEKNHPKSHFEMYCDAMDQIGANRKKIDLLIKKVSSGTNIFEALETINIDHQVKEFLKFSFDIIGTGKEHYIASAFTFGREDIIPGMFIEILRKIDPNNSNCNKMKYYLNRHIELDSDLHGPIAQKMGRSSRGSQKMSTSKN